jgi:hypothetical protein
MLLLRVTSSCFFRSIEQGFFFGENFLFFLQIETCYNYLTSLQRGCAGARMDMTQSTNLPWRVRVHNDIISIYSHDPYDTPHRQKRISPPSFPI